MKILIKIRLLKSIYVYLALYFFVASSCNHLKDEQLDTDHFQSLFNGKDLRGWEVSPDIITSIEDQEIIISNNMRNRKGFLLTEKEYDNFHFKAEVFCQSRVRGGIVFRHNYLNENKELITGYEVKLYNTNNTQNPSGSIMGISRAFWINDFDPEAWNTIEVIAQGDYLSTFINGTKVTETHNRRSFKGKIGFTTQAARVLHQYKVRNISIKEILITDILRPKIEDVMRSNHRIPSFSLFDGNDISKWRISGEGDWDIQNAVLTGTCPDEKFGFLRTNKTYKNFYLKLKFNISKEHNSGVFIRQAQDSTNINLNTGLEINIYDSNGFTYPWPTGSVVGKARSYIGLVDYDEWNTMEVFAFENHICTYVNGIKASEYYTPTKYNREGNICLQVGMQLANEKKSGSKVMFKDIRVFDFSGIDELGF